MSTGKIIALLILSMVPLSIGLVAILNTIHPNSEQFREAPAHNAQRHSQQAMPVLRSLPSDESAHSGRIRLRYNKPRGGDGEIGVHTGTVEFSCSSENPSNVRVSLAFEKAYAGETSSPDDGAILSWGRGGVWTLDRVYTLSGGTLTFNRAAVAVEFLKWFDTGYPTARITATNIGMDSRGSPVMHKWFVRGSRETQRDARFVEALDIFKEAAGECVRRYEDHEWMHG